MGAASSASSGPEVGQNLRLDWSDLSFIGHQLRRSSALIGTLSFETSERTRIADSPLHVNPPRADF
jgi:hypothetical protein